MMLNVPCRHCDGAGEVTRYGGSFMPCGFCNGSGLAREPKFRATCECGVVQPRATTVWTAHKWMKEHLKTHRPKGALSA